MYAYPSIPDCSEDDIAYGKNLDLLTSELAKPPAKQRNEILKMLKKRTFSRRREWMHHLSWKLH